MTNPLDRLYATIEGRTPGPWYFSNGYCYQKNDEFDDALWTANPLHQDAKFIVLIANHAALISDVIRGVDALYYQEGQWRLVPEAVAKLIALKTALSKDQT